MMQAKIKTAWLDALRSGAYAQAREVLHVPKDTHPIDGNTGYCCLGVLLDVAINEKFLPDLELEWIGSGDQVSYVSRLEREECEEDGYEYNGSTTDGQLGLVLCAAFGIDPRIESDLVNKNDGGEDFLAIADYIEEVL